MEDHKWGHELYLNKEAHEIIPIVVDEIRKRAVRGDNPIYLKSSHILEDNRDRISPELLKKGGIFNKQLVSKSLRVMGFTRKATNHHNSVFSLRW